MTREARTQFGSALSSGRRHTSAKGRVCEVSGCTTVLSVYNALSMCAAHEMPRVKPPLHRR